MADDSKVNARGFRIYADFEDRYKTPIYVVKSSLATEACVWIQLGDNPTIPEPNIHLTVDMAKQVVAALQQFVDENDETEEDES